MAAELNLSFWNSSKHVPADTGIPDTYSDWAEPWAWLLSASQTNILGIPFSVLYDSPENIDPQAPATRGETAQILYNIFFATDISPY